MPCLTRWLGLLVTCAVTFNAAALTPVASAPPAAVSPSSPAQLTAPASSRGEPPPDTASSDAAATDDAIVPTEAPAPAAPAPRTVSNAAPSFAVFGGLPRAAAEEPSVRALLATIDAQPAIQLAIHIGNFKGSAEPCSDTLYAHRKALWDDAPLPLVLTPGQNDWLDCGKPSGGDDATQRLDTVRETFFDTPQTLGKTPLPVTRQSEVRAFAPYRENIRFERDGVIYATIDTASISNHFVEGGGRNGEFDDRSIANRFWLTHAASLARQRHAQALIIITHADPHFEAAHEQRFDWLGLEQLGRRRPRDPFRRLRATLLAVSHEFRGPILMIHADDPATAHVPASRDKGFRLDHPLSDEHGVEVANFTRLALATEARPLQWLRITLDKRRKLPFRIVAQTLNISDASPDQRDTGRADSDIEGLRTPDLLPLPPLQDPPRPTSVAPH
ncbi:MAG: hypothetical protein ACRYGG_03900 [Janthinobacterium lividum]